MFGLFATREEKLQKKYEKLMQEAYKLSTINREASDKKYLEADEVMKEIEELLSR